MFSVYVLLQAFSLVVSLIITKLVEPLFFFYPKENVQHDGASSSHNVRSLWLLPEWRHVHIWRLWFQWTDQWGEGDIDEHSDAVDTYIHFRGLIKLCWHMARNLINVSFSF